MNRAATSSLPVPLSPVVRISVSRSETRRIIVEHGEHLGARADQRLHAAHTAESQTGPPKLLPHLSVLMGSPDGQCHFERRRRIVELIGHAAFHELQRDRPPVIVADGNHRDPGSADFVDESELGFYGMPPSRSAITTSTSF